MESFDTFSWIFCSKLKMYSQFHEKGEGEPLEWGGGGNFVFSRQSFSAGAEKKFSWDFTECIKCRPRVRNKVRSKKKCLPGTRSAVYCAACVANAIRRCCAFWQSIFLRAAVAAGGRKVNLLAGK